MYKRAQENAFKQLSNNFKSALQALRDVTTHLPKAVPTFEAGLPANMSRKDEATQQAARKAIANTIEE